MDPLGTETKSCFCLLKVHLLVLPPSRIAAESHPLKGGAILGDFLLSPVFGGIGRIVKSLCSFFLNHDNRLRRGPPNVYLGGMMTLGEE